MVKTNNKILLDYIERNYDNPNNSIKDLILMIMGLSHIENSSSFHMTVDAALVGTAAVIATISSTPVMIAGAITAGIAGCSGVVKHGTKLKRLRKAHNDITVILLENYTSFVEAYIEISNMILRIERDDLIEFFNKANALK